MQQNTMHRIALKLAILSSAALAAASAGAVTVDFEDLAPYGYHDAPFSHGGLTFSTSGENAFAFTTDMVANASGADNIVLVANYFDTTTTIATTDGTPFTLQSFDFADTFNFGDDPLALHISFRTTSGTFTETRFADLAEGLQTESFGISNLLSFDILPNASLYGENAFMIDNIRYSTDPVPSVPEPASWALMLAGFGLIGLAQRRRTAGIAPGC